MAGLAHGVPLLCLPMGRDQHGNAARVAHLGSGRVISADADATQIAEAVQAALNDRTLQENARRIGLTLREEIAADQAVIELESLVKGEAGQAEQALASNVSAPISSAHMTTAPTPPRTSFAPTSQR